jgi:hypothetical protein
LRVRSVQQELEKLDFKKVRPGTLLREFVFDEADFSIYETLRGEDFSLFSGPGLDDFDETLFRKVFRIDRRELRVIIEGAYRREGDLWTVKDPRILRNPLIMSITRTLSTSLEFLPLFSEAELLEELRALSRFLGVAGVVPGATGLTKGLIEALQGREITHSDGMKTHLDAVRTDGGETELRGIFRPGNKPYTMTLVRSKTAD